MEWRESDGVRWLEAELPAAPGRLLDPARRRQRGALRQPQPRRPHRRRRATRWSRTGAGWRRRSGSTRAGPDRPARSTAPSSPSTPARRSRAPSPQPGSAELPEVDGHVVAEPGLAPLVFVADCLPVALAGPGGVAMLHCGWRGLAAGIVARGAEAVGATDAAIGPGIGPCCYEVGDEVLDAFAAPRRRAIADRRAMLDLPEVARRLLREAGVGAGRARRALHELRGGALLLPPPRRRAHRPPGRPRLDRGGEA